MTPEDPKRLLAELESARLALQARARPPGRSRQILSAILLLVIGGMIGGVALVLLARMAHSPAQKETPVPPMPSPEAQEGSARSFQRDEKNTFATWIARPYSLPFVTSMDGNRLYPIACAGFSGNG